MSIPARRTLIAFILIAFASQAAVAAGPFKFARITIDHSKNVNATAINSDDTIVGAYADSQTGTAQGFIRSARKLTKLPPPFQCGESNPAYPTAINARGTVTGYCVSEPNEDGWVWQRHEYVSGDDFLAGQRGGGAVILENKSGEVAYTADYGHGWTEAFAGPPASPQPVQGLEQDVTVLSSMNDRGVIAGTTLPFGAGEAIFVGTSGNIATFDPPGATSVSGGFVNNAGQVAGSYVDNSNVSHGLIYKGGKFTYFELPKNATSVSVSAINNSGRVVGVYVDTARDDQRIFFYNGTTVSVFRHFPAADVVHLALSDSGALLLSDYSASAGAYASYRGTCGGAAC